MAFFCSCLCCYLFPLKPPPLLELLWPAEWLRVVGCAELRVERNEPLRTLLGADLVRMLPDEGLRLTFDAGVVRRVLPNEPVLRAPPKELERMPDADGLVELVPDGCFAAGRDVVFLDPLERSELLRFKLASERKVPFVPLFCVVDGVLLLLNEPPLLLLPKPLSLSGRFTVTRLELPAPPLGPRYSPLFHLSRIPPLCAGLRKWSRCAW